MQLRQLEAWSYLRCDQWKKTYRYTLVNEFRTHITEAKNAVIRAFELQNKFREEKGYLYGLAVDELSIVESNMDIMIMNEFAIMSEKEWAQAAAMIDTIRVGLAKLINSLNRVSGSEFPNLGTESASADYKDA